MAVPEVTGAELGGLAADELLSLQALVKTLVVKISAITKGVDFIMFLWCCFKFGVNFK